MTLPTWPTRLAITRLIASLGELDPESTVRAELCKSLALRIDTIQSSKTGAQSMALPGLVKQLETSMDALMGKNIAADEFLRYLMSNEPSKEANV